MAYLSILYARQYDDILLGRLELLSCLADEGTTVTPRTGHTAPVGGATPPAAGG